MALALLVAAPLRASAHSYLVSSQPADGAQRGLAPGAVVLDFSEPLNPTLSQATVSAATGLPVTARPVSAQEIRVDLITNAPGRYRVVWVAVSREDGHTTQGGFSFTVEARGSGAPSGASSGPSATDAAIAVGKWVEDTALLLAVGMLLMRWLARRNPELSWVRPRLRVPFVVALLAGCVVITSEALVASGGNIGGALIYFGSGPAQMARVARVILELYAVAAVSGGARILWPAVLAPVVALAASGHASGTGPRLSGIALDSAHLVATGAWAGGILAMATLRPPSGWRVGGVALLRKFTPWALGAFSLTVGSGVVQAIANLGSLNALIDTGYGRVLLVKAGLVGLMLPFSLLAWRLRRPRMRIEAGVGVAVVAAAALLASSPVPARGALMTPAPGQPAALAGLPHGSQLTLGDHAGQVLIGMTVEPGEPGPNQLTVYLLPLEGASAAAPLDVGASLNGASLMLSQCGDPCRSTHATLRGGETVHVTVGGPRGGIASFVVPQLPAANGISLVSAAVSRMHLLHSYAMHETLTSGGAVTVLTDYQAVAPDRLAWTVSNGSQAISIGSTRYNREHPIDPWVKEEGDPTIPEPTFVWDSFTPYLGVHILGHQVLDGVSTTILGFFGGQPGTPVWFRLWIDNHALIHRAEMRAPGHFMDQTFGAVDAHLVVAPPTNR